MARGRERRPEQTGASAGLVAPQENRHFERDHRDVSTRWDCQERGAGPSLAFSSFTLPSDWWLGDRKTILEGGVFTWLYISGPRSNGFPERLGHFEPRDEDHRFLSCDLGFEGWNVIFIDHSVTVQAFVGVGPGARNSDAAELLNRLAIRPNSLSLPRA